MSFLRSFKSITLAAGLASTIALAACGQRAEPAPAAPVGPTLLFSYEALTFKPLGLDAAKASYADRAAVTTQVKDTELPKILALLNVPADQVQTEVTPGGYQLETNASLQSAFETDPKTADLFAAAVGYTFRQWSVLVTDFTPEGQGNTGYAVVTFKDHAPSGEEAQAFFQHAASVNKGLGGGYTAFGRDLFFLNIADSTGKAYSGLDDATFVAELTKAAETFTGTPVSVTRSGRVDARFVENDWDKSKTGQDYAKILGRDLTRKLTQLRREHDRMLRTAGQTYGWK
ncbi:hypothetical protein [Inquilinus limosus]|uniref:hypothetical protein n=1 Tax=Inquilinus limosus TaxID=171674 RepID=UPI000423C9FF|nr:hypothetical protein [Inquilinus limosus]